LRLFDPQTGNYLDTYSEAVRGRRQAEQQARQATQQLERERHEKELLAQQLRALGINPEEFLKKLKST
jgi:hypothetical protein